MFFLPSGVFFVILGYAFDRQGLIESGFVSGVGDELGGGDAVEGFEFTIKITDATEACIVGGLADEAARLFSQETRRVGRAHGVDVFGKGDAAALVEYTAEVDAMHAERACCCGEGYVAR